MDVRLSHLIKVYVMFKSKKPKKTLKKPLKTCICMYFSGQCIFYYHFFICLYV